MPFRRDIPVRDEDFLNILRDPRHVSDAAASGNFVQEVPSETTLLGDLLENRVHFDEPGAFHHVSDNARAKSGSTPLEQPVIMLIVPVGAMESTVAFLILGRSGLS